MAVIECWSTFLIELMDVSHSHLISDQYLFSVILTVHGFGRHQTEYENRLCTNKVKAVVETDALVPSAVHFMPFTLSSLQH